MLPTLDNAWQEERNSCRLVSSSSSDSSSSNDSTNTTGSSSSSLGSQPEHCRQQQGCEAPAGPGSWLAILPCREALLLLLEMLLLDASKPGWLYGNHIAWDMMCNILGHLVHQQHNGGSAEHTAAATAMLQPVLHLLGPHILAAQQQGAGQQTSSVQSSAAAGSLPAAAAVVAAHNLDDDAIYLLQDFAYRVDSLLYGGTSCAVF
jgi:hypothetical protein